MYDIYYLVTEFFYKSTNVMIWNVVVSCQSAEDIFVSVSSLWGRRTWWRTGVQSCLPVGLVGNVGSIKKSASMLYWQKHTQYMYAYVKSMKMQKFSTWYEKYNVCIVLKQLLWVFLRRCYSFQWKILVPIQPSYNKTDFLKNLTT